MRSWQDWWKKIPLLAKLLIGGNSLVVAVCGFVLAGGAWRDFSVAWDGGFFPIPSHTYEKREYVCATALTLRAIAACSR